MRPERVVVHGLGDSLTAAIADVWTNGGLVPWHEILVDRLRLMDLPVTLTSTYARVGATSADVLREQVSNASIERGDLVCLWVGGNDVLRSGYTPHDSRAAISAVFDNVRRAGGVPLSMELPRISSVLPGPSWAMRSWDEQGALINALTAELSMRSDGLHVLWPGAQVTGPDGTHLSQAGHYHYAAQYAIALARRWGMPPPDVVVPNGLPTFTAWQRRWWYVSRGTRWLLRRRVDRHGHVDRHRRRASG